MSETINQLENIVEANAPGASGKVFETLEGMDNGSINLGKGYRKILETIVVDILRTNPKPNNFLG